MGKLSNLIILGAAFAVGAVACMGGGSGALQYDLETENATQIPVTVDASGKMVMIDAEGKTLSPEFDALGELHDGMILYGKPENDSTVDAQMLYGYLDKNFKEVIPARYLSASDFSDGVAFVSEPESCVKAIDRQGQVLFELPDFYAVLMYCNGYAHAVDIEGKFHLVDKKGNSTRLPDECKAVKQISDGYLLYTTAGGNNRLCRINAEPFKVEAMDGSIGSKNIIDINAPAEAAVVESGGNYGLMKFDGEYVVNPQYKEMMAVAEVVFFENKDGKMGVMDWRGNEILAPKYKALRAVDKYDPQYFIVSTSGERFQIVDRKGETVMPPKYTKIEPLTGTLCRVSKDGKYGIVDAAKGEVLCEPQFEELCSIGKVIMTTLDGAGHFAVVSETGKILSEEIFAEPRAIYSVGARSFYFSNEQLAAFMISILDKCSYDMSVDQLASVLDVRASSLEPYAGEQQLAQRELGGNVFSVMGEFDTAPVRKERYGARTFTDAHADAFEMFVTFKNPETCHAVIGILTSKYKCKFAEGQDIGGFDEDPSMMLGKRKGNPDKTISVMAFDY